MKQLALALLLVAIPCGAGGEGFGGGFAGKRTFRSTRSAVTSGSTVFDFSGSPALADQCTGMALEDANGVSIGWTRSTGKYCTKGDGTLVWLTANQPSLTANGIDPEGGSTNLTLQSQTLDVDASGWTFGALTVTANNTNAPDGTTTAERLNITAGSAIHRILPDASTVLSGAHTISAYVKMGTDIDWARIYPSSVIAAAFSVDLNTCVAGTVLGVSVVTTGVQAVANGFCRFWLTYTGDGVNAQRPIINFGRTDAETAVGTSWTAAGTETVYAFGVQHEAGFVSSYIPTTTASVARGADVVSAVIATDIGAIGCATATVTHRGWVNTNGRIIGTSDTSSPIMTTTSTTSKIADGVNTQTLTHSSVLNAAVVFRGWWSSATGTKNIIVGATAGTADTFDGSMNMGTIYLGSRAGTNDFLNAPIKNIRLGTSVNGCQ